MLEIKFPIFPIKTHKSLIQGESGLVLIIGPTDQIYILDDTSLPGTFGQRRLKIKADHKNVNREVKFYYLRKSLRGWAELAHHVRKSKVRVYIDSTGYIFHYAPTTWYTLTYHKILKVINTEGKGWHIEVSGINAPLKLSYQPTSLMEYAGIIKLPTGFIVYELSSVEKTSTRRKL